MAFIELKDAKHLFACSWLKNYNLKKNYYGVGGGGVYHIIEVLQILMYLKVRMEIATTLEKLAPIHLIICSTVSQYSVG